MLAFHFGTCSSAEILCRRRARATVWLLREYGWQEWPLRKCRCQCYSSKKKLFRGRRTVCWGARRQVDVLLWLASWLYILIFIDEVLFDLRVHRSQGLAAYRGATTPIRVDIRRVVGGLFSIIILEPPVYHHIGLSNEATSVWSQLPSLFLLLQENHLWAPALALYNYVSRYRSLSTVFEI